MTMLQAKDPTKHRVYKALLHYKKTLTSYWGYFGRRKFQLAPFIGELMRCLSNTHRCHVAEESEISLDREEGDGI